MADSLFDDLPEQRRLEALENLSELLLQARDPSSGTPLLSIRYHLFLRSLEGAFISYWPEQHVYLDRKGADANCAVFEVALCRECGQHYIIAQKDFVGGKVREPVRDAGLDEYGVTFLRPMDGGESEGDDLENEETPARNRYRLCVRCGEMGKSTSSCDHAELIDVVRERSKDEDAPDQIVACGSCGYSGAGRDPVREVVYGADGPHVVIATALHQYLPEGRKKVLAFADGRQEAAYFAWYLESSYAEIVGRRLILSVARELSPQTRQGLSLSELAKELDRRLDDQGLVPPSMGDLDRRRAAWARLYKEFLTDEPRNSLEGTGLVAWSINWPKAFQPPRLLTEPPWSLTPNEARALVFVLLDSARTTRAVEIRTEQGITLNWQDLELQGAQRCITGVETGKLNRNEQRWTGVRGRRVDFLKRYLRTRGVDERECVPLAVGALRAIWEAFRQADSAPGMAQAPLLIPIRDARRLNPNWWRLRLVGDDQGAYRCQVCGRTQTISMGGICSRYTCPGTLEPLPADGAQRDHYRLLYEEVSSPPLRVEEHTAQLAHEKAREFQRDFREGRINVLSCSTTFELGVDLGDLDTTFLRNVPPEAFNYAQRVGRAGRRSGTPGFAITYCRRNPHDLYHYADPWPMLAGQVRPPVITLQNSRIVSRHVAAVALSAFFRSSPGRFGSVGEFLVDLATPSGTADFLRFLKDRRIELEKTLRCIVPFDIQREIGLEDDGWVNEIAGPNSRFALAEAEMASDFQILSNLRERAHQAGEDRSAAWAGSRMRTLKGEDALSFLSRKAIIPKYGFPVDVVELDTQRWDAASDASNVTLQRDLTLAIAEFAPTSKLIANKKVWTSYGVKRVAERELPKWWYARCETHARFERVPFQTDRPLFNRCCDRMVIHQYVEPQFGFITSRDKPAEPKGRPAREFTTRPYFGGFKSNEGSQLDFGPATINVVSPGYMVVLCEGRRGEGFFLCNRCGAGFRSITRDIQAQHLSPYGEPCSGVLRPAVSLGHELVTDVLKIDFTVIPDGSIEPRWLAVSVAHALVEGAAELMDIPSNDLNTTVAGLEDRPALPSVIIYDNVPGGAGLVARLQTIESFRSCLVAARRRVSGTCGCDADTSCYGCLRNYRNQFAHPYLQRGAAYDYLTTVLSAFAGMGGDASQ